MVCRYPLGANHTDFLQTLLSEAPPVFSARSRSIMQSLNRMKVSIRTSAHISSNAHDLSDAPTFFSQAQLVMNETLIVIPQARSSLTLTLSRAVFSFSSKKEYLTPERK